MSSSLPGQLILASGSPYRRELLERLQLPFEVRTSHVDEAAQTGEAPLDLATRLAGTKATAVAQDHPTAWVIGSDQLAVCRGNIIGKPGNAQRCVEQLKRASGQAVTFMTAVSVVRMDRRMTDTHIDLTTVQFRELSEREIERYVAQEKPFDCAGGFKVEGLGISLFNSIETNDPTALIGLPMIWLCGALRRAGFAVP